MPQVLTKASVPDLRNAAAERALSDAGYQIADLNAADIEAVQDILSAALYDGWTERRLVTRISRVVGLGKRYQAAVRGYEAGLVANGVSRAEAAKKADDYATRLKKQRAQTIADHERRALLADAQRADWLEKQESGTLSRYAVRVFKTHKDEKRCKTCKSLNGRRISLKDSDVPAPPLHPNCRCWEVLLDEGVVKSTTRPRDVPEQIKKHLRGQHDQSSHGHDKLVAGMLTIGNASGRLSKVSSGWYLANFAVRVGAPRGEGAGSAFLRELGRRADAEGVEVRVHARNDLHGFYGRHGFVVEGEDVLGPVLVRRPTIEKDVRRVRTPAGVRRFNLPIGSPIVPQPERVLPGQIGMDLDLSERSSSREGVWEFDARTLRLPELPFAEAVMQEMAAHGIKVGDAFRVIETNADGHAFEWGYETLYAPENHPLVDQQWRDMRALFTAWNNVRIERAERSITGPVVRWPDAYYDHQPAYGMSRHDARLIDHNLIPVGNMADYVLLTDFAGDFSKQPTRVVFRPFQAGGPSPVVGVVDETLTYQEAVERNQVSLQALVRDLGFEPYDAGETIITAGNMTSIGSKWHAAAPLSPDGIRHLAEWFADPALTNDDPRYISVATSRFTWLNSHMHRTVDSLQDQENEERARSMMLEDDDDYDPDSDDEEGSRGDRISAYGLELVYEQWGWTVPDDTMEKLTEVFSFSHGEYSTNVDGIGFEYDGDDKAIHVQGSVQVENGEEIGTFSRYLNLEDGTVYNSLFTIEPEFRDTGFASAFNAKCFDWYAQQGFQHVHLSANIDVGGYAWARQGFDWQQIPMVIRDALGNIADGDSVLAEEAEELYQRIESGEHVSAFEVSELGRGLFDQGVVNPDDVAPNYFTVIPRGTYGGGFDRRTQYDPAYWPGKNLLLGADWHGYLPLDEFADALNRFGTSGWKRGMQEKRIKKELGNLTSADVFVIHMMWEREHWDDDLFDTSRDLDPGDVYPLHVVDVEETPEMAQSYLDDLYLAQRMKSTGQVQKYKKVKTLAGVRRYGLPIGSPIVPTADVAVAGSKSAALKRILARPKGRAQTPDLNIFRRHVIDTGLDFDVNEVVSWDKEHGRPPGDFEVSEATKGMTKGKVGRDLRRRIRAMDGWEQAVYEADADTMGQWARIERMNQWGYSEETLRSTLYDEWAAVVGKNPTAIGDAWLAGLSVTLPERFDRWKAEWPKVKELIESGNESHAHDWYFSEDVMSTLDYILEHGVESIVVDTEGNPAKPDFLINSLNDLEYAIEYTQTKVNLAAALGLIDARDHFILSNTFTMRDIWTRPEQVITDDLLHEPPPFDFMDPKIPVSQIHLEVKLATMVRHVIDQWAETSNSEDPDAHATQHGVRMWSTERFGEPAGQDNFLHDKHGSASQEGARIAQTRKDFYFMFFDAMYAETQEYLAEKGITSLPLYRGMVLSKKPPWIPKDSPTKQERKDARSKWLREWVAAERARRIAAGKTVPVPILQSQARRAYEREFGSLDRTTVRTKVSMNALSSWGVREGTAWTFSSWAAGAHGKYSVILWTHVPAERVMSLAVTGLGALNENEAVLLGYDMNVTARTIEPRS